MNRGTLAVGAVLLAAAASGTGYASPAGSIGGGFMGSDGAPLAALADSFVAGSLSAGERLQPDPFASRDYAVDVRGGLRGHAADEAAAKGSGSAVASPSGDVPSGSGGDLEAELLKALEASTVFNPAAAPSPPEDFRILSSGPVDLVNDLVVAPAAANDAAPSSSPATTCWSKMRCRRWPHSAWWRRLSCCGNLCAAAAAPPWRVASSGILAAGAPASPPIADSGDAVNAVRRITGRIAGRDWRKTVGRFGSGLARRGWRLVRPRAP